MTTTEKRNSGAESSAAARQRGSDAGRRGRGERGRWHRLATAVTAVTVVSAAPALSAQSLAQRAQVRDGQVRLSFATRPDVCGSGRNIHVIRETDDWEADCEHGPARVVLEWRDGALVDVDTYVAGRWRPAGDGVTDLGMVRAPEAAHMLLDLAGRVTGKVGDDLVLPATLADSVEVWPTLVTLAKNDRVPRETRKAAVFWLGQAAGDRVVAELGGLATDDNQDREIQEQAVFALSQLRDGGGVPRLLEIAQTHKDARVRKSAMFWLGQSNDPRAIALFEEILKR